MACILDAADAFGDGCTSFSKEGRSTSFCLGCITL